MGTVRKCPHCKGKTGYKVTVWLSGYQEDKFTFSGSPIDSERHGADQVDKHAECLDCGKSIPIETLKYKS